MSILDAEGSEKGDEEISLFVDRKPKVNLGKITGAFILFPILLILNKGVSAS